MLFLASCDNDDDDIATTLSFDKDNVEAVIGANVPTTVTVSGAKGRLTITAKEAKGKVNVMASVKDQNIIEITGKEAGEVALTFKDDDGKTGIVKVTVLDPKTRFIWNDTNKREEIDGGIYTLTQDSKEGKVSFTWTNNINTESIALTFMDKSKKLETGDKTEPTLTVNGKSVEISSVTLSNIVIVKDGSTSTLWIKFNADGKDGICVATLNTVPK